MSVPAEHVHAILLALTSEKRLQLKTYAARFKEALQHFTLLYAFRDPSAMGLAMSESLSPSEKQKAFAATAE